MNFRLKSASRKVCKVKIKVSKTENKFSWSEMELQNDFSFSFVTLESIIKLEAKQFLPNVSQLKIFERDFITN